MNRTLVLTLAAGLASSTLAVAQAAPAAPSASAPASAVAPQALPTKVAIIAFEQAVVATNEGQKAFADIQKKYEPKKSQIDSLAAEVDSLKKQVQALPANTSDDERANRLKAIDTKEKQLQRDAEDAQNSYQQEIQEALGKISQKVGQAAVAYAQKNGFTLLLNVGGNQQAPNPVLWFDQPSDITQAVITAYNTSSGIAAPAPSAPRPQHSSAPASHPAAPAKK